MKELNLTYSMFKEKISPTLLCLFCLENPNFSWFGCVSKHTLVSWFSAIILLSEEIKRLNVTFNHLTYSFNDFLPISLMWFQLLSLLWCMLCVNCCASLNGHYNLCALLIKCLINLWFGEDFEVARGIQYRWVLSHG